MENSRTVDTIPKVALEGLYHPAEETEQEESEETNDQDMYDW